MNITKKAITILVLGLLWGEVGYAQHGGELCIAGLLTMESGAIMHVLGDVHLMTSDGSIHNSGTLGLEGHFYKDASSQYNNSSSGSIRFQNTQVNINEDQILDGDFTGPNALFALEVAKTSGTALVLKNGDLEILDQLTLTSGFIKTNPLVSGIVQENVLHVANEDPNSINGDLSSSFITGKFSRNFTGNSLIILPTGSDSPGIFGPQPVELNLKNGLAGILEAQFTNDPITPLGTTSICDVGTPPDLLGTPDGIPDTLEIDCRIGKWSLNAPVGNPDFDLTLYPSQSLRDQCDFKLHFIGANGILLDNCPLPNFSFTDLTEIADFDIPGVVNFNEFFLSVELRHLEAVALNDYIKIQWTILSEFDHLGFELQRSLDGQNFDFIVWKEWSETESEQAFYSHEDREVQMGHTYYYRLKIIDRQGNTDFSEIVSAKMKGNGQSQEIRIFPNPVSNYERTLNFDSFEENNINIRLFDNIGIMLMNVEGETVIGNNILDLPKGLSSGSYHLLINDQNEVRRATLVILE